MVESEWSAEYDFEANTEGEEIYILDNRFEDSLESDPDTMMLKYQGEVYEATFLNDDSVEVQPFGGTLSSAESHGEEDTIKQALEQANYESEVEMEPVTIS